MSLEDNELYNKWLQDKLAKRLFDVWWFNQLCAGPWILRAKT